MPGGLDLFLAPKEIQEHPNHQFTYVYTYIFIHTHIYIYIYKHIQCIYMYIFIVILRSLFRYTRRPALMGKWLFFQLLNLFATSEVNAVWQMWCQWCLHHKIVPKSGCILVWWKARKHKLQRCFRGFLTNFFEAARFVRRLRLNVFLFKVGSQGCQGCRAVYGCM